MKLYRGVKIAEVKLIRYEIRSADNKKLKSFTTRKAAQTWVDGYLAALRRTAPKEAEQ